ncbi:ribonuclease P protein subunit p29 [Sarocladium implicatum]|nr:ribonuclease P protein subunit p29 [Sarocladium implicatum]
MSADAQQATRNLLARAHSPDSVERIFTDKIQYRTLQLRPSSPPPHISNAREARRRARQAAKDRKKLKPKPLSSRERRKLGLHDIPREGHKYEIYEPLNRLWQGYIREILGNEILTGGQGAAAKLSSAEFHGAAVEVVRSHCPVRVGISGIVVRDRKFVLEIITKKRGLKVVPKEGTTFRVVVPVSSEPASPEDKDQPDQRQQALEFDILGDQLMLRSVDRANRKFKSHFLESL